MISFAEFQKMEIKIATIVEGIASKLKPGQLIEFKQGILDIKQGSKPPCFI